MCPNCRAFIHANDRVCPYCEMQLAPSKRQLSEALSSLVPGDTFVTSLILLLNVGLYLATVTASMKAGNSNALMGGPDGRTLLLFGAKYTDFIAMGQWWRLLTSGFLHGGLLHIFMNLYALMDLGATVEKLYGPRRLIVIYTAATMGGFLVSALWSRNLSVGASAGLFGLLGAMLALTMKHEGPGIQEMRASYVRYAIYGLAIGFLPGLHIDNGAHVGGLAAGFVVGWQAGLPMHGRLWMEKVWSVLAWLSGGLTVAAFLRWYLWFAQA